MPLQRDVLVLLFALGVAAALYVISFHDLMANATPAANASLFEHSDGAAAVRVTSQIVRIAGRQRG